MINIQKCQVEIGLKLDKFGSTDILIILSQYPGPQYTHLLKSFMDLSKV